MSYDFTTIPTIDLSRAKNPVTKDKVLQDLRHAILNVGFLYISNHGVPADVTRKLVDALPRLFALPNEEKAKIALINSPHFLGYSGFGTERTAGNIDGRQQFEFATELTDDWTGGQPLAERLKGPNQVHGYSDGGLGFSPVY
jgi:isopenicillin N synthase-like dioxygenase